MRTITHLNDGYILTHRDKHACQSGINVRGLNLVMRNSKSPLKLIDNNLQRVFEPAVIRCLAPLLIMVDILLSYNLNLLINNQ